MGSVSCSCCVLAITAGTTAGGMGAAEIGAELVEAIEDGAISCLGFLGKGGGVFVDSTK
jgi:hypothetical protein